MVGGAGGYMMGFGACLVHEEKRARGESSPILRSRNSLIVLAIVSQRRIRYRNFLVDNTRSSILTCKLLIRNDTSLASTSTFEYHPLPVSLLFLLTVSVISISPNPYTIAILFFFLLNINIVIKTPDSNECTRVSNNFGVGL